MSTTPLPDAVQRQLLEAEAIEAAMAGPAPEPPAPEPPAPEPPAPEPPAPAPDPAPAPAPEPWEQRYRSLQGMYDSALQRERAALEAEVAALKAQLATPPAPTAPPAVPGGEKDGDTFGDDLVEMVERRANALVAPILKELNDLKAKTGQVESTTKTVAETQAEIKTSKYLTDLTAAVSDWSTINADQRWLAWLAVVDPLTGQQRQALLDAANTAQDAVRVANIFNAFKATIAPPPTPPAPTAQPELESQIAPAQGPASSAPMTPPGDDVVVTSGEIQSFYLALSKGEYKGREAEATQIEAAIDRAIASGRVRA